MDKYYGDDDTGLGGFSLNNIRNWIIEECLKSGDPEKFFSNLQEVVNDLDEDWSWMEEEIDE